MLTLVQDTIYMGTAAPSGGGSGDAVWGAITGTLSNQTDLQTALNAKANSADLATVATSGSYNDLSNKPTIPTVIPADNSTITENASNELQTVGVINHNTANDATNPLQFWEGTQAEWNTGGGSQTWYNWQTSGTASWTTSSMPSSENWQAVTYGDGKFVAIVYDSNMVAYSTDGINWTASSMPSSENWQAVTYGDGKFVSIVYNSNKMAYSTDGINWTASSMPDFAYWSSVTYGNGKFVAIARGSSTTAYSTDGINWTGSSMPDFAYWQAVTYGDGKFVAISNDNSNTMAYSTDGINWTASSMPSNGEWQAVTYGNGKFVAISNDGSNMVAYSTDGINWTASSMPSSEDWQAVTYGDGKFVSIVYNSNTMAYSTDGINWTASSMPDFAYWSSVTYGDSKFVAVIYSSDTMACLTAQSEVCYTDTENPSITSTVYSAPNTISALTITAVGTGTITLSDTNTYSYNASGNQTTTQSIGVAYPNWLCNIEGIGVKIGTTDIANLASYTTFTGTNGISEGTSGLVPAPSATDNDKFLCGNGTWSNVVTFENQNKADGAISPLKVWNGTEQEWNTGGGSQTWYNWKTEQINADTMLSGEPTFAFAVAASDSYAVAVCGNGFSVALVNDRIPLFLQWEEVQFPTDFTGSAIAYGNGKFVCLSNNGKIAYATDPTNTSNWTVVSLPNGTYSGIRYINSRFVVFGSDIATSTDGVTWTAATMPSDVSSISDIAYGNSIYIVGGTDSSSHNVVAASSDLSTWNNAVSFPTTFYRVAFGNGVFVVINGGDPSASYYSTNGTTWTQNNLSNLLLPCMDIVFGNGVFFVKSSASSSDAATSIDGISWSNNDVDSSIVIISLATNGTTFVGVGNAEGNNCICVVLGKSCYTSEASPTIASTVYSAPNVASALTIQYVDMGMEQIFLSDNNTYTYDATGNLTTNTSVGVAHPDYLCFINGVGVKIGTTVISEVAGS